MVTIKQASQVLILCFVFCSVQIFAQNRYVKPIASGNGSGTSWADASDDLAAMISSTSSGYEVWVASGTYLPSAYNFVTNTGSIGPRDRSFYLKSGVKLYGGFAGTETNINQRSFPLNHSILSGDFNGDDVVTGVGSSLAISNNSENAYHVVVSGGALDFDGFKVIGGNANGTGTVNHTSSNFISRNSGGGFYPDVNYPAYIKNCIFEGNSAATSGGALHLAYSPAFVNNVVFSKNTAEDGGAINSLIVSQFRNCIFYGNSATNGGAVAFQGPNYAPLEVTNSTFFENSATNGTSIYNYNISYNNYNIQSCVLWNTNGGNEIYINPSNSGNTGHIVRHSILKGLTTQSTYFYPVNSLDTDPIFKNSANPLGNDGIWMTNDDGLQLACNSPAFNTGENNLNITEDILHVTRPKFTTNDMGAYESSDNISLPIIVLTGNTTACNMASQTVSGGNTYSWSGGNTPNDTLNTFNASGTYTVTAISTVGCTATSSVSLTVNPLPTPIISGMATACGTVDLTVSGGVAYQWSGGNTPNDANNIFTTSGVYDVTVTDSNGCTASKNVSVTVNTIPSAALSGATTACSAVNLSVPSAANTSYLWSGGNTPNSASNSFNNSGNYSVTATTAVGCSATNSVSLTVNLAPDVTVTGSLMNCTDLPTIYPNFVTAQVTNTTTVSYQWNAGYNIAQVNFAYSGIYTVTATNTTNGCTASATINYNIYPSYTPTILGATSACYGNSVTLSVNNGVSFVWSGGNTPNAQSNTFATSGTYSVTCTNVYGCVSVLTTQVTIHNQITSSFSAPNGFCLGKSITVNANTSINAYAWSGGTAATAATNSFSTVATYTVTLTASTGCTYTTNVAINTSPTIALASVSTCGTETYTASGGQTYAWSGGNAPNNAINAFYTNGTYTITVTNSAGCSASTSANVVLAKTNPAVTISGNTTACDIVSLTASGGQSYQWSGGNTMLSAANTFSQSGNYTVTVTGANNCTSTQSNTITVNPLPVVTITAISNNCVSSELTASGASTYVWSSGSTPNNATNIFSANGTYTVTATSTQGCKKIATTTVALAPFPTAVITGDTTGCVTTTLTASGAATYTWSGGSSPNTAVNTFDASGVYTVTVSESSLCSATKSVTVTIAPLFTPVVTISVTPSTSVAAGSTVNFSAVLGAGLSSANYQWYLNNVQVGTNSPNYTLNNVANADKVKCSITTNAFCQSNAINFSNEITMTTCNTTTYFVKPTSSGTNDGLSWANAMDLQTAMNTACANAEIWLIAGTYLPTQDLLGNAAPSDNRDKTFLLKTGLKIYGGFAGTETLRSQRNLGQNQTILSGDFNGNDNNFANNTENAYHVVTALDAVGTVLDGVIISGANANIIGAVTVGTKSILRDHGGGLHADNTTIALNNVFFTENNATVGGGIFNQNNALNTFTNVVVANNKGLYGAGIFNRTSNSIYINVTIVQNSASISTGGVYNQTGAFPIFKNAIVWGNTGQAINNDNSYLTATNSIITGGYAGVGNTATNPVFSNATNLKGIDGKYMTADDGLILSCNSSAYNTGTNVDVPTTDIVGLARPQFGISDRGAYESTTVLDDNFVVTIQKNVTFPILFGSNLTYTANVTSNYVVQSYQWSVNNVVVGTNTNTYSLSNFSNGDLVKCTVLTACGPAKSSQSDTLWVCSSSNRLYVKPIASGTGDGSSWANASSNLQAMISSNCGSATEVWVAAGTYKPTQDLLGNPAPNDNRDKAFLIKYNIKVYGGFSGTEMNLSDRNLAQNKTILSGDFNGDDNGLTNNSENAYHVLVIAKVDSNSVFDGFIIRGGNANNVANVVTNGLSFRRDQGGNISVNSSQILIKNVVLYEGYGSLAGGIYIVASNIVMVNAVINANSAIVGAGIFNYASSPKFFNTTIYNNSASALAGNVYNQQGSLPIFTNCILWNGIIYNENSTSTFNYSIIEGGYVGTNNSNANPNFVDAANPRGADNIWLTSDDGLLLTCHSSAMNNGLNSPITARGISSTDIMGNPITDGAKERGAYENIINFNFATISITGTTTTCDTVKLTAISSIPNSTYLWSGGLTVNTAQNTFLNTGFYTVSVPNAQGCIAVKSVSITVTGLPSLNITVSPSNQLVPGIPAIFTAFPTNGGTAPQYQWYKNNTPIAGAVAATYTTTNYTQNDSIWCVLTPNHTCFSKPTVVSNKIKMSLCTGLTKVYVKSIASGTGDGSSWANAMSDLSTALSNACFGMEFWVAAGTYKPTKDVFGNANPTDTLMRTFYFSTGAKLYGGFAGTETSLSQRNITTNKTILSGNFGTNKAYHVLVSINDQAGTIDGIEFKDAVALGSTTLTVEGYPLTSNVGAGIYVNNSNLSIKNCTFSANYAAAGAGIYLLESASTITDCTFSQNGGSYGAGAFNKGAVASSFNNCLFNQNSTNSVGGAIYIQQCLPSLTNCSFTGNTASVQGGAVFIEGANPQISGCNFTSNSSTGGGAIFIFNSYPSFLNSTFTTNTSGGDGGAIYTRENSGFVMDKCILTANSSGGRGGAILMDKYSSGSINNTVFDQNHSADRGGAISYNKASETNNTLTNCIFHKNTSGFGGNVYTFITDIRFYNCLGISSLASFAFDGPSEIKFYNTLLTDNIQLIPYYSELPNLLFYKSHINIKNLTIPVFKAINNPKGADGIWLTDDDGLYLDCASPFRDAGNTTTTTTDIRGNSIYNVVRDLGAYENQNNNGCDVFDGATLTCATTTVDSIKGNRFYNFFIGDKLVATLNPNGQNLGNVTLAINNPTGVTLSNANYYLGRHINITSTIAPTANYTLRLYYRDAEMTEYNTATNSTNSLDFLSMAWKSGGTTCNWTTYNATTFGTVGNNQITNADYGIANNAFYLEFALNHFTMFAPTTSGSSLPLTLVNFQGKNINARENILAWVTENEKDVSHFELERSQNGQKFESIGQITARNKKQQSIYQFSDNKAQKENYYRLKMIDNDGKFEYSKIIYLKNEAASDEPLVYPNPVEQTLFIKNIKKENGLSIYNNTGIQVLSFDQAPDEIDTSNLPNGIYFVKTGQHSLKFIKL